MDVRRRKAFATVNTVLQTKISDDDSKPSKKAKNGIQDKMGGVIRALVLILTVAAATMLYMIFFMPSPVGKMQPFSLPSPPDLEEVLQPNTHLLHTTKLYEGLVRGPESLVYHEGNLYTGTADGKVLIIKDNKASILTTFGRPPCGRTIDEPNCGRPLGMRMDRDGYLIVIDTYKGLYKVNVSTGEHHEMFPATMHIDSWPPHFLNDLDIDEEGMIYLTDSCKHWRRRFFTYCLMQGTTDGRLIKYNPKKNSTEVLLTGMLFANGVQLSRQQDYVLIAETGKSRIFKYMLRGEAAGTVSVFVDNLPGLPDNIRVASGGGYWVGLVGCRSSSAFSLYDFASRRPWVRKLVSMFLPAENIQNFVSPCTIVVKLDEEGNIVGTLQDLEGKVLNGVSEVLDDKGTLYFGSFKAPFIGKIKDPLQPKPS